MAYSRFTINKREKQTLGLLLGLALLHFLNMTFPALKQFWSRTLGQASEVIENVGETVSTVGIGYIIVVISGKLIGWGRFMGMVLGWGLILASLAPLFMQGKSLADVLGGIGNRQING